ncbi:CD3324 family protein [Clostridium botulinum]|uniref:CD3324 family protein n=1 Tax=Clostridium botulinum TaxID=1491 RepID=UPI003A803372
MKYINAQDILPEEVLENLYKYIEAGYLYIPRKNNRKKSWGENSGIKVEISKRNLDIYNKHLNGEAIDKLAKEYYLSESSIKRIIYNCKKEGS